MREDKRASILAIIGNSILFVGKIIVGILYNSIAIISDALNSLTDIVASLIVHISLLVSYQSEDKDHQFGHTRAQPIAGLIVAIFTGIVGFEVIIESLKRILFGGDVEKGFVPIILVICVLITKYILYVYTKGVCKRTKSTALRASMVDHLNDILISIAVLVGIILTNVGFPIFDPIVGIAIGIYIIKAGYDIGRENTRFLMGDAPSEELFRKIEKTAQSVKGVIGLNDIRAHYVGTMIECEVHIYVDPKLDVTKSHDIGKRVKKRLESVEDISHAFIHIDPFRGRFWKSRRF